MGKFFKEAGVDCSKGQCKPAPSKWQGPLDPSDRKGGLSEKQWKATKEVGGLKTTPRELLWSEYKGSMNRKDFDYMLKKKQENVQKLRESDLAKKMPKVVDYGKEKIVVPDTYPAYQDLDEPVRITRQDTEKFKKKNPGTLAYFNPGSRRMVIRDDTGSSIPHETRHSFLRTTDTKANKKLYDDIKPPRKVPYADKDPYSTEHGLVHLGLLHKQYVKNHPWHTPVLNDAGTENFINWMKKYQQKNDIRFDANDPKDQEYIRRHAKVIVENRKPKKTQLKVASVLKDLARAVAPRITNVSIAGEQAAKSMGDAALADYLLKYETQLANGSHIKTYQGPKLSADSDEARNYVQAFHDVAKQRRIGETYGDAKPVIKEASNKPYSPKLVQMPGKAKIPNIRPNPVNEKDLITTKADSILNRLTEAPRKNG